MYNLYRKVDADDSGEISYEELLVHIDVEKTPFSKRIFTIFDEDGSGQISFLEFVLTLWYSCYPSTLQFIEFYSIFRNYCTLGKGTLVMFAFDLYDRDTSGFIDRFELITMLKEVYGPDFHQSPQARLVFQEIESKAQDHGLEGSIGINTFREYCAKRPALLFPAFQMQYKLQKSSLGIYFWEKYSAIRMEISKGEYMSISQLINLHVHEKAHHRLKASGKQMSDQSIGIMETSGPLYKRGSERKLQASNSG